MSSHHGLFGSDSALNASLMDANVNMNGILFNSNSISSLQHQNHLQHHQQIYNNSNNNNNNNHSIHTNEPNSSISPKMNENSKKDSSTTIEKAR
jgi:hypothetical protein